eukprot:TRINITY_DN19716_c0_g1_i2.p1 TRINITY_DN19716_c0_g1~~TRINITY_DN19716_c0_g1_i2.p1  ORF type:complete len:590 (-),score=142.48 TRINITY_DN19716_c0_g1_i2:82-1851(-)
MAASAAQPNFFLWGAWKTKTITQPFLTKKVHGSMKKVVLGESFVVALKDNGQVISWGKDTKTGCLGLGYEETGQPVVNRDMPHELDPTKLGDVCDIQMGLDHVVALTLNGEVYCWGQGKDGQLGNGHLEVAHEPQRVELQNNEPIAQIAVIKNSTFALATNGVVYAWGSNKDNVLGLDDQSIQKVKTPTRLTLLQEMRVRKLEVFEGRTIIAHVKAPEAEEGVGGFQTAPVSVEQGQEEEVEIFRGIDEMRKAMEKTQEWWNHLLSIKHGQPYDLPHDASVSMPTTSERAVGATVESDLSVEQERLHRAERHLGVLVSAAVQELKRTQQMPGTRNVRFILCMFIDECRLRREKVQRTIGARQLMDAKRKSNEISAYSVVDFSENPNEEIRKIIAVTKELQQMLDAVKTIQPVDVLSLELKVTLMECLECKLQLHDTQVELLKAMEAQACDPMLPALRVIKDRWDSLKHFSLYALYLECEQKKLDFGGNDDEHLAYLVKASNAQIDQILQIDKDAIISHDSLVPGLCYDLLRENAELRKMTNSYQLHVLMLYQGKNISEASVGMNQDSDPLEQQGAIIDVGSSVSSALNV